jgi:hypothetical protein
MSKLFERLDYKKTRDLKTLGAFISIFCRENHRAQEKNSFPIKDERARQSLSHLSLALCQDCQKLLSHGMAKLLQCRHDPKPACKNCLTHCYASGYRESIRQVMRFSGLYLIKRGRLDLIAHYLF